MIPADPAPPANSYYPTKADPTPRFSGYIALELTTKTPVFIRGTRTEQEVEVSVEAKNKSQFFQPRGELRIPGSSLRGMTRSLVEILSASKMEFVGDQQLFYRAVGAQVAQSIAQHYRAQLFNEDAPSKLGYIEKRGSTYILHSVNDEPAIFRIYIDTADKLGFKPTWSREPVWFVPPPEGKYAVNEMRRRKADEIAPGAQWQAGWYIASGPITGKKKNWVVRDPVKYPTANEKLLEVEDVQAYRDAGLTYGIPASFSVLPRAGGDKNAIPCFYIEWEATIDDKRVNRISFGHTGYFRLPYQHNPFDAVPKAVRSVPAVGVAEAIFGSATDTRKEEQKSRAGRVFFEDALLLAGQSDVEWPQPQWARILSAPKPTTFQHYLAQPNALPYRNDPRQAMRHLRYWDSPNAMVRGHKLYWHRSDVEWRETNDSEIAKEERQPVNKRQRSQIRPINPQTRFVGRVRFENLLDYELGALLVALDLPEGYAHKLGMGKPLGLGSVRLDCELHLINRQARYANLFDGNAWSTGETSELRDTSTYKKAFLSRFVGADATEENVLRKGRLGELGVMLSYDRRPSADDTSYMLIEARDAQGRRVNEYRDRPILPFPHDLLPEMYEPSGQRPPPSHPQAQPSTKTGAPQQKLVQTDAPRQISQPPKDKRLSDIDAMTYREARIGGKAGTLWGQYAKEPNAETRRVLACRLKQKMVELEVLDALSSQKWMPGLLDEAKDC